LPDLDEILTDGPQHVVLHLEQWRFHLEVSS